MLATFGIYTDARVWDLGFGFCVRGLGFKVRVLYGFHEVSAIKAEALSVGC